MANAGINNGALTTTNAASSRGALGLGTLSILNTPIPATNGGSGQTSFTVDAVIVSNGSGVLTTVGPGNDGQILIGSSTGPIFANLSSSDGSLIISNGPNTISIVSAQATTSQKGSTTIATNAEAVTGTDTSKVIVPAAFRARMAEPGAIGGTTPAQGDFISITLNSTSGPTITTGSGAPTASAPLGSIYFNISGSTTTTRAYVNTNGSTGWTPLITVA